VAQASKLPAGSALQGECQAQRPATACCQFAQVSLVQSLPGAQHKVSHMHIALLLLYSLFIVVIPACLPDGDVLSHRWRMRAHCCL
jgi:hypothetical protein